MRDLTPITKNALTLAYTAHREQRRKWGNQEPYICHPIRVASRIDEMGGPR
jgi:(p)ppGpp synthase/HD superfamily hydrolase